MLQQQEKPTPNSISGLEASYPESILPKSTYKLRIPTTDVLPHSIVRQSLTKQVRDSEGEIIVESILRNGRESFGLSCNLFSNYQASYLAYRIVDKELNEPWEGNSNCEVSAEQFTIVEPNAPLFFLINKLHGSKAPYTKTSQVERETRSIDFKATCELIHKPTLCNYWHFEVHFMDAEDKIIDYSGSAWQKNLVSFLTKSFFLKAVQTEEPLAKVLAPTVYTAG